MQINSASRFTRGVAEGKSYSGAYHVYTVDREIFMLKSFLVTIFVELNFCCWGHPRKFITGFISPR